MDWSTHSRATAQPVLSGRRNRLESPLSLIHVSGAAIYEAIELSPSSENGCIFQTLPISFPVPRRWIPTGD
ncbi:hypothetical protein N7509_003097 [Penicillium cosmopolitanum]|uniref:Uncharacterized protein n=1 Tax=Penicillium cosmopolitanum TaxID=1131564 RepID=A0A9X0BB13_9EURO|nr:uncharacterized protein N7509_003097 [Penicillium cosmopolitanum]KAJ5403226.1 hypothetical protein N7509_003097 [Penicillium cosmopolitanum]